MVTSFGMSGQCMFSLYPVITFQSQKRECKEGDKMARVVLLGIKGWSKEHGA